MAIHGVGGNTATNTGTGAGTAGVAIVSAVGATTITLLGTTGNGTYTSGGTVTLTSR